MDIHKNARTCFYSRLQMVKRVLAGEKASEVAVDFAVSVRTVYKWNARSRAEGKAGLKDRCSRPHRIARATEAEVVSEVLRLRQRGLVVAEIAFLLGRARSTVARVIQRAGLGHIEAMPPAQPVKRYEKDYAGELVHLDIKKLGRIVKPGHRVTGDERDTIKGAGWEFTHVAIDDYSRSSTAAIYPDEKATSAVAFLKRVVDSYRSQGVQLEAIMTDNGACYLSKAFRRTCRQLGLKHIRTRPYRPQTNGKAERFIQTLLREWAYRFVYQSSAERRLWLDRYLHFYNHHRMHQALNALPPISRLPVNNLLRMHT